MGNLCNAHQFLLDLSKNLESYNLINKNYTILFTHLSECIQLNYNKISQIKDEIEENEIYKQLIYEDLDKLWFYNDKIVKKIYMKFIKINNFILYMNKIKIIKYQIKY